MIRLHACQINVTIIKQTSAGVPKIRIADRKDERILRVTGNMELSREPTKNSSVVDCFFLATKPYQIPLKSIISH